MEDKLYSLSKAAQIAERDPSTLRHAIRRGRLRGHKPEGSRDWFVWESDLRQWMAGHKYNKK